MSHELYQFRRMIYLYSVLVIPSLAQVRKFGGVLGILLYLAFAAGGLWLIDGASRSDWVTRWPAKPLVIATLLLTTLLFVVIYPYAKSGVLGPGSDSDDSLNVSVRQLLQGHYPYYARTYLHNSVHEMPGMLVLSVPFVILGNSAYSNLMWIAVFFLIVAAAELGATNRGLLLMWLCLSLSPVLWQQILTGGDQITNGLMAVVGLWCIIRYRDPAAAIFFGLTLSSRFNFLLFLPAAFGFITRHDGPKAAIRQTGIAMLTFILITVPFYLYDPTHFTPLEAANRLTRLDRIFPHLGYVVGFIGVALSIWLATRTISPFSQCALVQAFFVVAGAVLIRDWNFTGYGVFFLFPGALAASHVGFSHVFAGESHEPH